MECTEGFLERGLYVPAHSSPPPLPCSPPPSSIPGEEDLDIAEEQSADGLINRH